MQSASYAIVFARFAEAGLSVSGVAAALRLSAATVRSWHYRDSIPEPWWERLAELAERRGIAGVDYDTLRGIARARRRRR